MCGIVGLFAKSADVRDNLGTYLSAMLAQMNDRGPDSAGVAVYRNPAPDGTTKLVLHSAEPGQDWEAIRSEIDESIGIDGEVEVRSTHCVLVVHADAATAQAHIRATYPALRVMSAGQVIEIYKEVGLPTEFVRQFNLGDIQGSSRARAHADGDRERRHDAGLASVLDRT